MNLSNNPEAGSNSIQPLDFDINGIVGIRVLEALPVDVHRLVNQFGIYQAPLNREPDITLRFKNDLSPQSIIYLGLRSTAFTERDFYILENKKGKLIARIPFEDIGNPCEIVFVSGNSSMELLFDIIKLTFLRKNYIPIHASAFHFKGIGVLVAGWTKGGKTEALLSFVNQGADYVGDELVFLSKDGEIMFGIPIGVTLWDWQFKYIPRLLPRIDLGRKILFKGINLLDGIYGGIGNGKLKDFFPVEILGRAVPFMRRGLKITYLPQRLFEGRFCQGEVRFDKVFLIMSHNEQSVTISSCNPIEVAQRMASSNEQELIQFFDYYRAFRFAFPGSRNEFLEGASELQRQLLYNALDGKEAFKVLHPYPVSLDNLFDQLQPFVSE